VKFNANNQSPRRPKQAKFKERKRIKCFFFSALLFKTFHSN
jgi:hypothetical protein